MMATAYFVSLGAATLATLFVGTLFAAAGRGIVERPVAQPASERPPSPQGSQTLGAAGAASGVQGLAIDGWPISCATLLAQSSRPAPARETGARAGSRHGEGLHWRDESRRSGRFGVGYEWRTRSRGRADAAAGESGPDPWGADSRNGNTGDAP